MKGKASSGSGGRPLRMQERGYKALTVYVKAGPFKALKRYCFDEDVSQSELLGRLLEEELKRKGYV